MRHAYLLLLPLLVAANALTTSCRDDEVIILPDERESGFTVDDRGGIKGLYVLCEGNMGSNKCTLDFLDLSTQDGKATYSRNIYPSRNPEVAMELGDVGNDIQIYGSQLWIAVNASNKVEVANASTCRRLGQVDIPNCRNITFKGQYAYVSSYVGPVQVGTDAQIGRVYRVDTASLSITGIAEVGYQPEEMAVVGDRLYVANSGGYRVPYYDNTVSVVDLNTFQEVAKIEVCVNLHRLRADRHGQLWVSSRGDYFNVHSNLFCLSFNDDSSVSIDTLGVAVSDMSLAGDSLYFYGSEWNYSTSSNEVNYGIIDVSSHKLVSSQLSASDEIRDIEMPYGIIVNPIGRDFYLMDAKNYVSSGELLHFLKDGTFDSKVSTGDIPGHAAFLYGDASTTGGSSQSTDVTPQDKPQQPETLSPYILAVDEYVPAPGQFINSLPAATAEDTPQSMAQKCTQALANNNRGLVCLGGFGGYITFHFDHPVANTPGAADLLILGNALQASGRSELGGSSEPGIVMVSADTNGNGLPDDEWYELAGAADSDNAASVTYNYQVTYSRQPMADIPWVDNRGGKGVIARNSFHTQEYYPLWLPDELSFTGTRLPSNAEDVNGDGSAWFLHAFRFGYVDNLPNSNEEGCSFDIDWAVDANRQHVALTHVDFVRVYSAMNQSCGSLGETSTEISGAADLALLNK